MSSLCMPFMRLIVKVADTVTVVAVVMDVGAPVCVDGVVETETGVVTEVVGVGVGEGVGVGVGEGLGVGDPPPPPPPSPPSFVALVDTVTDFAALADDSLFAVS